jgi:hypothetical protein
MKRVFIISLGIGMVTLWSIISSANGLGGRFGLNYANANTDPPTSIDSRAGLMVGGIVEIDLTNTFMLQGEAMYVEKSAKLDIAAGSEEIRKYRYVEFPVSLKAKFGNSEKVPYLFVGPNLGFIVSAKSKTKVPGQPLTTDLESSTEEFDIALDVGGGVEYPFFSNASLMLDIRYSLGILDIDKTDSMSWRTNGLQMILGVIIRI